MKIENIISGEHPGTRKSASVALTVTLAAAALFASGCNDNTKYPASSTGTNTVHHSSGASYWLWNRWFAPRPLYFERGYSAPRPSFGSYGHESVAHPSVAHTTTSRGGFGHIGSGSVGG